MLSFRQLQGNMPAIPALGSGEESRVQEGWAI